MALPLSFPENTDVTVTVNLVDLNGDAIIGATAVNYRVLDADGTELQAPGAAAWNPGDPTVDITVPAILNVLPTGPIFTPGQSFQDTLPTRVLRIVEARVTGTGGVFLCKAIYVVAASVLLQTMVNSFQTLEQAILQTMDMPELEVWPTKTDAERLAAMTEAFFRLIKLGYRVRMNGWGDSPPAGYNITLPTLNGDWVITPRIWPILKAADFANYPQHFRQSMAKAQIAEADIILGGDVTSRRRNDGLMSETIGQSSQMFRPGKPLIMLISPQALKYLTNYIDFRQTICRS